MAGICYLELLDNKYRNNIVWFLVSEFTKLNDEIIKPFVKKKIVFFVTCVIKINMMVDCHTYCELCYPMARKHFEDEYKQHIKILYIEFWKNKDRLLYTN